MFTAIHFINEKELIFLCSLTTAAALKSNPAIQARAFIVLGVLCRSSDLVTDDLMDQVLSTLKSVCANTKSVFISHAI